MSIHVIMHFDGRVWGKAQYHVTNGETEHLLKKVRELLHGRWTKRSGQLQSDGAEAFWNSGNGNRVLVMTEATARQIAVGAQ